MFNTQIAKKLEALKSSTLKGHMVFDEPASGRFLEKRFALETPLAGDIRLAYSKDPELLQQYYAVREKMYKSYLNDVNFDGSEDDIDRNSDILLALSGDACVGGARITYAHEGQVVKLPCEADGIDVTELFPTLDLKNIVYGEVSRIVLLPEYATGEIAKMLHRQIISDGAFKNKVELSFFSAYPSHARSIRQSASKVGFKVVRIPIERPKSYYISDRITLDLYAIDMSEGAKYVDILSKPYGQDLVAEKVEEKELEHA